MRNGDVKKKTPRYIAIAGNIGSGKTTLAKLLNKHFGWKVYLEDVSKNPYLVDFYEDMGRWAFPLQIYFLNQRFKQIKEIMNQNGIVVQDRTIYEDAYVFVPTLYEMGYLSEKEYSTYYELFQTMVEFIKPPDLLVYLKAQPETLVNNILKRQRSFEINIRLQYIKRLNEKYENWIKNYTASSVLPISVDLRNFETDREDMEWVLSEIKSRIFGLFPY